MKHTLYNILSAGVLLASMTLVSCNDLLDESPDNRTEIDTPKKVKQLLTSAYPKSSAAEICELSGDNLVDNNVELKATHQDAQYPFHEEAYAWKDINNYSIGTDDTPYTVWEAYYQGIAVCNHALQAIYEMEAKDPSLKKDLDAYEAEALVLRAYCHFVLVNVFSKAWVNAETSKNDLGITYITDPETVVKVDYTRPSVDSVYNCIERDMLRAIDTLGLDDSKYSVSAYHFTENAGYAFAARFYLYKREYAKVVSYANKALGQDASAMMRKWSTINQNSMDARLNWYNDVTAPCNFMIQATFSLFDRMLSAKRFAINGVAQNVTTYGSGPNWSGQLPCYDGNLYIFGNQDFGVWMFRVYEYFEYTDKIAGIGYVHMLYQPFTAEETLLCRAEAELFLGNTSSCISDLSTWTASKKVTSALTAAQIERFYYNGRQGFVCELNADKMGFEIPVTAQMKPYIDCILHFRRIETMYEGLRWFDIKRFGIPVVHKYRGPKEDLIHVDTLTWDDNRRALQIPNDVISAGYEDNDRGTTTPLSSSKTETPILVK